MRKLVLFAAVAASAAAFPAASAAADWQGVVVARDAGRGAVATASRGGVVRTVRTAAIARLRVGDRVAVRARARVDGTYAASRVRKLGRSGRAVVRGTVVLHQRRLNRTVISAGGSVLAVSLATPSREPASSATPSVGDIVSAAVRIGAGGRLAAKGLREVGTADVIELEGIFLDQGEGVLRLAVVKRGLVVVRVPEGAEVPAFAPGDVITLVVSLDDEGRFVLVSAAEDGGEVDAKDDEITVRGAISALGDGAVSVKPGAGASPVRCLVPAAAPLDGFFVGDEVELHCHFVDGSFRLEYLHGKSSWLKVREDAVKAELGLVGTLAELDADAVRVTVKGRSLVCALPAGAELVGFEPGTQVKVGCRLLAGRFQLAYLKSEGATWHAGEGEGPTGDLSLEGVLIAVAEDAVSVRRGERVVTCARGGADLLGFFVEDVVFVHCHLEASGLRLAKLASDRAYWKQESPSDAPQGDLTVEGTLEAIDGTTAAVRSRGRLVTCSHGNAGLPAIFPAGQVVELHCHLGAGGWRVAMLQSDTAKVVLEP